MEIYILANNITQVFEEAGQDAQSLQEFVNNPANLPVNRRLAPPIKPLSHYEQYMDSLAAGKDATITSVTAKSGAAGTEASVLIGGTPSARTFEFTIPKGENASNIYQIRRSYQTYELMVADKANIPANTSIDVTNDEDYSENGTYTYDGTSFTKSIHDTQEVLKKAVEDIKEYASDAFGQAIQDYGYVTIDSFELGATLTQRNQALRHAEDGKLYRWAGDLPKTVPASSTPENSGGFGANAWLEVSDTALRQDIISGDLVTDKAVKVLPVMVGAIERSQASKNADLIHAKDFGLVNSAFVDNTAKMRAALSANGVLNLEKGATYLIHEAVLIKDSISGINGNGAKIIFDREQTSISAYDESNAFYNYDRKNPLFIRDLELEYTGTFDKGGSYDGQVSGIDIRAGQAFSGLSFKNITASGFNRAGIQIAQGGEYINNVVVEDCYLHHNRVAGCWYGNVDNIRLQGNRCEYNGIASDPETGYGLSGISSYYPKNIFLLNNICQYNYRKGIDTHSGYNVFVQGNTCKSNKYYGIAIQNRNIVDGVVMPQGYIIIRNNSVTEMSNDGTTSLKSMYGIVVGKYEKGETTTAKNTFILIEGNHVSDFTTSGLGNAVPIEIAASGFNKLNVHISNNMVNVGRVDYFVSLTGERSYLATGTPSPEASLNNYADYNVTNNTFTAQNILSNIVRIPANIGTRSMKFDNNYLNITGAIDDSAKFGLINFTSAIWEDVGKPINSTFTFCGNTVYIPSITEFMQDIVTNYSEPHILQEGNIFNGKPYRTYKDGIYSANLPAKPTTGLWTVGSVVRNTTPAVGSPSQWICTTSGTGAAAVWSNAGVL